VLTNGITVLVLPETVTLGTDTWTRVRTQDGTEGWVVSGVLAFPTLAPPLPVTPTP
jgi:SH3-like domain-containing protein